VIIGTKSLNFTKNYGIVYLYQHIVTFFLT